MSKIYSDFYLASKTVYFYFDKEKAQEEARKQRENGEKVEVYSDKGSYTVFIFKDRRI
jgi:hypothetical protein